MSSTIDPGTLSSAGIGSPDEENHEIDATKGSGEQGEGSERVKVDGESVIETPGADSAI